MVQAAAWRAGLIWLVVVVGCDTSSPTGVPDGSSDLGDANLEADSGASDDATVDDDVDDDAATSDAASVDDAAADPDGSAEMDGSGEDAGGDAGADATTDATADVGAPTCTGDPTCPQVTCDEDQVAFPQPLTVRSVSLGTVPITMLSWVLRSKPPGSAVMATGPDASSFMFTPDVPGRYEWCVTPTGTTRTGTERCCMHAAVTDFTYSFNAARSTRSVEDVEFLGGNLVYWFDVNQTAVYDSSSATYEASNASWMPRVGVRGWSATFARGEASLRRVSSGQLVDVSAIVNVGDVLTVRIPADPYIVGEPTVMEGTISLGTAQDPGPMTPRIEELVVDAYASLGGTVKVRFAADRPASTTVEFGGWRLNSVERSSVRDDGNSPDLVAGDGWFTGNMPTLWLQFADGMSVNGQRPPVGTYSLLVRGVVPIAGFNEGGPYLRANVTLK